MYIFWLRNKKKLDGTSTKYKFTLVYTALHFLNIEMSSKLYLDKIMNLQFSLKFILFNEKEVFKEIS